MVHLDRYTVQIGIIVLSANVHTVPGQGQGPGPIVTYCASPIPCTGPSLVCVQCEYNIMPKMTTYFEFIFIFTSVFDKCHVMEEIEIDFVNKVNLCFFCITIP